MLNINPNLLISFTAGFLSFLSPCVLPLLPSYITFIGGVTLSDLKSSQYKKAHVVIRTVFFVLGFSIVFILLGIIIRQPLSFINIDLSIIDIIAGSIVILLGINVIFDFWKILNIEKRFTVKNRPKGIISSLLVGMAFGVGWSPCVGPMLVLLYSLVFTEQTMFQGISNLIAYSLGLGAPFIIASLFFNPFIKQLAKIKQHLGKIKVISGIFLILIGLLIFFGRLGQITITLGIWSNSLLTWNQSAPLTVRFVFGLIFLGIAFLPLIIQLIRLAIKKLKDVKIISITRLCFMFSFYVISVLQFAGIINIAEMLANWLMLQEIAPFT